MSRVQDILAAVAKLDRSRKLSERAKMRADGDLPCASQLPHRVVLMVDDVAIRNGQCVLAHRIIDARDHAVIGYAKVGFDQDGYAHIGFENSVDADLFGLSL